jgi:uncharacterized protein (DUF488 family)
LSITIWTVGHSTRTAAELRSVLTAHGIELVADVRRFPGSRRLPQFGAAALEQDLRAARVSYHTFPALGGRRQPVRESVNTGWRHPAFRGYADYLATDEFADGLFELLVLANGLRTALMCAEILWWRCHRRLLADVLVSLGNEVVHIRDATAAEPHRLAAPARLVRGVLTYAAVP